MPDDPRPDEPSNLPPSEPSSSPDADARADENADTGDNVDARRDETPEPIDLLAPLFREEPLRPEGAEAPPTWLWMIIFGVMLFSVYYLGSYVGSFSPDPWLQSSDAVAETAAKAKPKAVSGANIYSSRCANCHQANGEGVPNAFPPLNKARWVEDKGQIIRILLHGMQGPVEVRGNTYNGNMPAWRSMLSDEEIAAVISFVRQNWENDFPTVTPEEVAAVRTATEGQIQPWTAEELNVDENRTIPGVDDDRGSEDAPSNSPDEATESDVTASAAWGPALYVVIASEPVPTLPAR